MTTTFEEARAIVLDQNREGWEEDHEGTFTVAAYGWEDEDAFLVVQGASEWLVDGDESYSVMDAPAVFVSKESGTILEADYLAVLDRIAAMTPVPGHEYTED
ncbi:immunity protein [Arthrobacter phage KBurrousTX]|uniref:Uncharacterized protein n=1 Tax=Arthrobacter phage KBurrousTX TaxID=2315608 RepID=A0A386KB80_9CAUD|nr:immunity protein [Arthrobacter phage KBurrousTX]AYD81500.1 hypothetical protein KBurrousTX_6 [Arthrobacter phage KBurrousTX]